MGHSPPDSIGCFILRSAKMLPNSRFGVYIIHTCSSVFKKNTYNDRVEHKIIMIVGFNKQIGYAVGTFTTI